VLFVIKVIVSNLHWKYHSDIIYHIVLVIQNTKIGQDFLIIDIEDNVSDVLVDVTCSSQVATSRCQRVCACTYTCEHFVQMRFPLRF